MLKTCDTSRSYVAAFIGLKAPSGGQVQSPERSLTPGKDTSDFPCLHAQGLRSVNHFEDGCRRLNTLGPTPTNPYIFRRHTTRVLPIALCPCSLQVRCSLQQGFPRSLFAQNCKATCTGMRRRQFGLQTREPRRNEALSLSLSLPLCVCVSTIKRSIGYSCRSQSQSHLDAQDFESSPRSGPSTTQELRHS